MFRVRATVQANRLAELGRNAAAYAAATSKQSAEAIVERSKANLEANGSVDTGALLAGQRVVQVGESHYIAESTREGGDPQVPVYVELGTSRMPAKPYFYPAVESERPGFLAAMRDGRAMFEGEGRLPGGIRSATGQPGRTPAGRRYIGRQP